MGGRARHVQRGGEAITPEMRAALRMGVDVDLGVGRV